MLMSSVPHAWGTLDRKSTFFKLIAKFFLKGVVFICWHDIVYIELLYCVTNFELVWTWNKVAVVENAKKCWLYPTFPYRLTFTFIKTKCFCTYVVDILQVLLEIITHIRCWKYYQTGNKQISPIATLVLRLVRPVLRLIRLLWRVGTYVKLLKVLRLQQVTLAQEYRMFTQRAQ